MCASYGVDLEIPTSSLTDGEPSTVKLYNLYEDVSSSQSFRDARHEELCINTNGRVILSKQNTQLISPATIIDGVLDYWKNVSRPDNCMPPTKEKLDQAAYLFSYHMEGGCNQLQDTFGVIIAYGNFSSPNGLIIMITNTVTVVLKRDANADSSFHSRPALRHTFTRIMVKITSTW